MPGLIHTVPGVRFGGLDERMNLGTSMQLTTSLDNVIVRNGNVFGRQGIATWDGISSAAGQTIIGLMQFHRAGTADNQLLRMRTTGVDQWNSGTHAWDDVTGSALAGDTTVRPQWDTMTNNNFLVFTNEGKDRPRKWTGSGTTAVLTGTPPYCKSLCNYIGYLMLGNISSDGVTFSPINIQYSPTPDSSWSLCNNNILIMDETPGEIIAMKSIGRQMLVYKTDAIIWLNFVGSTTVFNRIRLQFSLGLLAPLSLQAIGETGHIFLATDQNLYYTNGTSVTPLPLKVQRSLQAMSPSASKNAVGYVDQEHETYHLLYQRSGSTWNDGRLSYNYRTGECYRSLYPVEFTRALGYKQNLSTANALVSSSTTLVYQQESGTDDNGTRVSRYYDVDWNQYEIPGSKHFVGSDFVFTRAKNCSVRISVAADHSKVFQYPRVYSLKSNFASDENVRIAYEVPSPIYGTWFKLRIEFLHYDSTNVVEMKECSPRFIPKTPAREDTPKQPSGTKG